MDRNDEANRCIFCIYSFLKFISNSFNLKLFSTSFSNIFVVYYNEETTTLVYKNLSFLLSRAGRNGCKWKRDRETKTDRGLLSLTQRWDKHSELYFFFDRRFDTEAFLSRTRLPSANLSTQWLLSESDRIFDINNAHVFFLLVLSSRDLLPLSIVYTGVISCFEIPY